MQDYFEDFEIDLNKVKHHYKVRSNISKKLKTLLENGNYSDYASLAVGVSDNCGNFSAAEHGLGPRILESNSVESIINLAHQLSENKIRASKVTEYIYLANLPYLKIGVGSEMACMLQPNNLWVGNVRTIWCHLVVKHGGDWEIANEELDLYRDDDTTSEMHYRIWCEIYTLMKSNLDKIYELSLLWAKQQDVKPGKKKYLWVDAICSHLYDCE